MVWSGGRLARPMRYSRLLIAGVRGCELTGGECARAYWPIPSQQPTTPGSAMAFIYYLTQIQLDSGALQLLPAECERIGIRKPLVVTDAGVRAAGVLDQALAALGALPHA